MLFDLNTNKQIKAVPYAKDYRTYLSRLSCSEIAAIKAELNSKIDGDEIHTAGWMPGKDWRGTCFQPIYEKAARHNPEVAAKFFGLIVWEVFLARPEKWYSGRFELDGREIGSRTYFRGK